MQILFDKINNGSPFGVIRLDLLKACFLYMKTSQARHSTGRHDFGKNLDSINVELSNPIESFDNPTNYPPITLPPLQTPVEIEEHRKNTTSDQNYNSLHYSKVLHKTLKLMKLLMI